MTCQQSQDKKHVLNLAELLFDPLDSDTMSLFTFNFSLFP